MLVRQLYRGVQLVSFSKLGSVPRVGVQVGSHVVDLQAADSNLPTNMRSFLEAGPTALARATEISQSGKFRLPREEVHLRAPISNPDKVICVGLNYMDHVIECKMAVPERPLIFSKISSCVVGPGDVIKRPPESVEVDYEVELVCVIGRAGRRISAEHAWEHVAGFTVGNDISARDWQLKYGGGQWLLGKTFDTFAPIGPCITTIATQAPQGGGEVFDPHALNIRCSVNGRVLQDSNTRQIIYKTAEIIEYVSKIVTLMPGDLIFTGTPPGVGVARTPQVFLKSGDSVTCEIEGIGQLCNSVIDG